MRNYTDAELLKMSYKEFSKIYELQFKYDILYEDAGVFHISNPKFQEAAHFLSKIIRDAVSSSDTLFKNPYSIKISNRLKNLNGIAKDNLKRIKYYINTDWLESLDIYLNIKLDSDTSDPDYMIVTNTTATYFLYTEDDSRKIKKFITVDNFRFVDNENNEIIPYIKDKDKVIQASIYFNIKKSDVQNTKYITYILLHELSHLADIWFKKSEQSYINRDKLDFVPITEKDIKKYSSLQKYVINNLVSYKATYEDRVNSMRLIDYESMSVILNQWIEALNESEMHSRLNNFIYDLSEHTTAELEKKYPIEKHLCSLSKTYLIYYSMYSTLKMFLKMTPNQIKIKIAENDIKNIYGKFQDTDYENNIYLSNPRAYDLSFSNRGNYDASSFNSYMNFHIDRIYNIFLKNAYKIYDESECILFSIKRKEEFNKIFKTSCINCTIGKAYTNTHIIYY